MQQADIDLICESVFDTLVKKSAEKQGQEFPSVSKLVDSLDVFNTKSLKKDCAKGAGHNSAINCAKIIMENLSMIDPTGLLTIAGAFMQPRCDNFLLSQLGKV